LLADCGAMHPNREALDQEIIDFISAVDSDTRNIQRPRDGANPNSPVGGNLLPTYAAGAAPIDSNNDGIPDSYEVSIGLNAGDLSPNDVLGVEGGQSQGYTAIEGYINSFYE